jgi:hypothetical protein
MSRHRVLSLTLWAVSLAVTIFLFWFSSTFGLFVYEPQTPPSYYALLAEAFLNGQLHLLEQPTAQLLSAENPYDFYQRGQHSEYLWDTSLYQGKYFLYFGAVPSLLFYLPIKVLLGFYPTDDLVIAVLSLATIAVLFATCKRIAEKLVNTPLFGPPSLWFLYIAFASSLSLQLGGAVYVVAAVSGMLFQSLALLCLLLTMSPQKAECRPTRWWWALLCGCAVIAAVGCRPTHLVLVPIGAIMIVGAGVFAANTKNSLKNLCAFLLPVVIGGAAIAWYNYARFESIFEFGQRYQLSVTDFTSVALCSLERAVRNPTLVAMQSWYIFLQPIHVISQYPFVTFDRINPYDLSWGDPQYLGADPVTGLFFFSPLIIPGLCAAVLVIWRASRTTQLYFGGCFVIAAITLAYLHTCVFVAARFLFEVVSVLLITTVPALWYACSSGSNVPKSIWRVLVSVGLLVGVCIGMAGSLGGHFSFKASRTLPFFQQLLDVPIPAASEPTP